MVGITGVTPPIIGAVFDFFDDFIAISAEQPTALATLVERKRSFAVSVARPAMRAPFGRRIGSFTVGIGTVPAIAVTHRIPVGRMMRIAFGTRPIMVATRSFRKKFPAFGTESITAITGNRFRGHINAIAVGAMPARGAMSA